MAVLLVARSTIQSVGATSPPLPGTSTSENSLLTSHLNTSAIWVSREPARRLVPFSYFWICWKVTPSISPSVVCDMLACCRISRTRLPIATSTGLGCLLFFVMVFQLLLDVISDRIDDITTADRDDPAQPRLRLDLAAVLQ